MANNNFGKAVVIVNGNSIPISYTEKSNIKFISHSLLLKDIIHVSKIKKNLLSVNKLCVDNNVSFHFDAQNVCVKDRWSSEEIAVSEAKEGLYELKIDDRQLAYSVN